MAHVDLLDETMRDGQQSLWGMRMQAGMALPVAPLIDRAGFRVIDLTGSSLFEVLIRHCQEDPWQGLDALVAAMPRTPKRAGTRSNGAVTFATTPDSLMELWVQRLIAHGVHSIWVYDVMFNIDKMLRMAHVAKQAGAVVTGAMMFTLSPVHSDEYYADKADKLSASPDVSTLLLYDTGGVLERDRLRTLIPALIARAHGKPIEFHSNNILGQSAKAYLDAVELGVSILHTSTRPLANGPAVPSTEIMAHNLQLMGHTHSIDTSLLKPVADHFERVGKAKGWLINQSNEYDVLSLQSQIPGGMMGTLRAHLAQHNMSEREYEVLREVAHVRRELGWPVMATPLSQLVGIQAVLNVVSGKRYSIIPDEVIQYAAGFYGPPVAPIEPDILDRIMSAPRAKDILASRPEQPTLAELRRRLGTDDDDELLLRALVPEADLQRMRAAGPLQRDFPLVTAPELEEAARLMRVAKGPVVQMRLGELTLRLQR